MNVGNRVGIHDGIRVGNCVVSIAFSRISGIMDADRSNAVFTESEKMELKSKFTDAVCKEIVAFLNADGGDLVIGVNDNGTVAGITNLDETSKKVSDVITDQIEPVPHSLVTMETVYIEDKPVLIVHIRKGIQPIYCQKKYGYSSSGCVVRIGTTCKNMTQEEIDTRYEMKYRKTDAMILSPASYTPITFNTLKTYYGVRGYHLEDSTFETNLNLLTPDGKYNLLAEIMSDRNMLPLIFVKFKGNDKSAISERYDYGNQCLLLSYEQIKLRIATENTCFSDTTVRPRVDRFLYDFDSVNEAVINALVHNDWTISAPLISFFDDRLEIFSYGGLPSGQEEEDFFMGVSVPRNIALMQIFLNMDLAERTGHGIPVIVKRYGREVFEIKKNYIRVTIPFDEEVLERTVQTAPVFERGITGYGQRMTETERKIISFVRENPLATLSDITSAAGVTVRTVERAVKSLQDRKILIRTGSKRKGEWIVNVNR